MGKLKFLSIVAAFLAASVMFTSCDNDEVFVPTPVTVESSMDLGDENIEILSTRAGSDVCSGPGGSIISMTGNKILSEGKHVISLTMSQNSNWVYGFSSLLHQNSQSSSHKGDVYWRVVKRRSNWGDDDYEVYRDCTFLTKGQPLYFECSTSDINTGGTNWTHIQLEIVVIGGSASVSWSSFNKSPWS